MKSLLCLTRYDAKGASSRYRFYQFLPGLEALGWRATISPLLTDGYIEKLYATGHSPALPILLGFARRASVLLGAGRFDLVWIEKELLPWVPAMLEVLLARAQIRYVVDYDDAIFHQYDRHRWALVREVLGDKIDSVMRNAALVTAGNEYLARRARDAGAATVAVVPTVIDLARYPLAERGQADRLIIGWVGSPSTQAALADIAPALTRFCAGRNVVIRAIGARPDFALPGIPFETVPWSEETESAEINKLDLGIMPLPDDSWSRGKCGLKLIQYMGCALPVIGSPVGVNCSIVAPGETGFLAQTQDEWYAALCALADDPDLRRRMGAAGRARVEARYSLAVTLPRLSGLLDSAVKGRA